MLIDSKLCKTFEKHEFTDFLLALMLGKNTYNNYECRTSSGVILTARDIHLGI